MRDRVTPALRGLLVLGACAALAWVVHATTVGGDYQGHGATMGDNAAPAMAALVRGQLSQLAARQPVMGLVSLVWRAPFVGVGIWLGAGDQLVYQLGAAACLISVLALVAWLAGRTESVAQIGAALVAVGVILAGPVTRQALLMGHPEEVLTTVLAAGAVIAAGDDRRGWAAVLLGLAVGSKPWALLATPCVLLALPEAGGALRVRAPVAIRAAAIALPAVALLPAADLAAFRHSEHLIGGLNGTTPLSLWWPVRGPALGRPGVPFRLLPLSLTRTDAAAMVLSLGVAAVWIYGRRAARGRSGTVDGLALLALTGLLRCLADPAPVTYYFVPVIIPLALWEAGSRRRLPVAAVLASAALVWLPQDEASAVSAHSPFALNLANLVWLMAEAGLGLYLLRNSFGRPRGAAVAGPPAVAGPEGQADASAGGAMPAARLSG